MENRQSYGRIAEMLVIKELNRAGFYVKWLGLTKPHPFDITAHKCGRDVNIEVKHVDNDITLKCFFNKPPSKNAHFIAAIKGVRRNEYDGLLTHEGIWIIPVNARPSGDLASHKSAFILLDQFRER